MMKFRYWAGVVVVSAGMLAGLVAAPASAAGVYGCRGTDGKVHTQAVPCSNPEERAGGGPSISTAPTQEEMDRQHAEREQLAVQNNPDPDKRTYPPIPGAVAYRCTLPDDTSYVRRSPCPLQGMFSMEGTLANGKVVKTQVKGRIVQSALSRAEACRLIKAERDDTEADYRAARRPIPVDVKRSLDADVFEICG